MCLIFLFLGFILNELEFIDVEIEFFQEEDKDFIFGSYKFQ